MTSVATTSQPYLGAPPAERGALEIKPGVFDQIIRRAVLSVPGVEVSSGTWAQLTRSAYPRIDYQTTESRIRVRLDIAATWPVRASVLASNVSSSVAEALTKMTGLHVDGVDVHIPVFVRESKGAAPARVVL